MELISPYNSTRINQRNYTMDMLKGIFSLFVILVHFPLPGIYGNITSAIGICGVIYFFLISGYSAYNSNDEVASNNILKRFKRNLKITLIVILIYFLIKFTESIIAGEFTDFISNFKNPWLFPRLLLLGDLSFILCDPLWFMVSLLYAYIILYILHKLKITKYSYFILPILIIFRIVAESYINTYDVDWHYSSFFLVSSLPIMLLGHYIAYSKETLLKTPLYLTIVLLIITSIFMLITINIEVFGYDVSQIFKIWSMTELFLLTLKVPGKKEIPIIGKIGRKYSLYIYLFHFLIGVGIYMIPAPDIAYDWIFPILAVIFGTLISIGIYELNQKLKFKVYNKKKE